MHFNCGGNIAVGQRYGGLIVGYEDDITHGILLIVAIFVNKFVVRIILIYL